ncbi:hypothetical protein GCM10011297_34340 [Bacterioplanes sanyensis]|uniref:hypothetical protein n=1 Tax=Bacterioplanes sanyensis TaxID=1249553 RepID=UPI00167C13B6|nr:hypothetical protein [Bacterioplanes sanyensis]GGY58834.1 hypothetical protein GCM10011297_34340 [Bacterioplanes sanyensis]
MKPTLTLAVASLSLSLLAGCSQHALKPNSDISGTIHGPGQVVEQQELVVSATTGSESGKRLKRRWLSGEGLQLQYHDEVVARYLAADVEQDTMAIIQLQLDNGEEQLMLEHSVLIKAVD